MKLLLHTCCAPCSVSCVKSLRDEGIEPELFWYNPNIHLYAEYESRKNCLKEFAEKENLRLNMIDEYGLRLFLSEVSEIENRCETCYRTRLEKAAGFAAENGYHAFSTTLLISPYQKHDAIKRIGEELAAKYGIDFLYRDFRPLFREGQSAARNMGFYMQKYCGCVFSEEERKINKPRTTLTRIFDTDTNKDKDGEEKVREVRVVRGKNLKNPLFDRLSLLTGDEGLEKLAHTKVLVFGLGGVGSWTAEALVRSGIGKIGIIDSDIICASNVNRQVEATSKTIGQPKADALKNRLLEINPACEITAYNELFCRENANLFGIENADFVIDAIDSLNHKLDLIETVCNAGVKLFSSMGMALKMNPSLIKIASIWKTDGCPLARNVRQGLRKRGFSSDFTVVYSNEQIQRAGSAPEHGEKTVNGSVVTVTASAGLLLASLVLRDILEL